MTSIHFFRTPRNRNSISHQKSQTHYPTPLFLHPIPLIYTSIESFQPHIIALLSPRSFYSHLSTTAPFCKRLSLSSHLIICTTYLHPFATLLHPSSFPRTYYLQASSHPIYASFNHWFLSTLYHLHSPQTNHSLTPNNMQQQQAHTTPKRDRSWKKARIVQRAKRAGRCGSFFESDVYLFILNSYCFFLIFTYLEMKSRRKTRRICMYKQICAEIPSIAF